MQLFKELESECVKRKCFDLDDRRAIKDYTGEGYNVTNPALRSSDVDAEAQTRIDTLVRAMPKSAGAVYQGQPRIPAALRAMFKNKSAGPPLYKGTVYRGAELPADIVATLRPGATFSDPAFLSSSTDKERATPFSFAGSCSRLFVITSKTGLAVTLFSSVRAEQEVLFRPGTMFKITSVELNVVTMEELV